LQLENPRAMAEALAAFFARHPLSARPPDERVRRSGSDPRST
jgi:hypothetical protein